MSFKHFNSQWYVSINTITISLGLVVVLVLSTPGDVTSHFFLFPRDLVYLLVLHRHLLQYRCPTRFLQQKQSNLLRKATLRLMWKWLQTIGGLITENYATSQMNLILVSVTTVRPSFLRLIHTEWKRKRKLSLMFGAYPLIFFIVLRSFSPSLPLSLGVNRPLKLHSKSIYWYACVFTCHHSPIKENRCFILLLTDMERRILTTNSGRVQNNFFWFLVAKEIAV